MATSVYWFSGRDCVVVGYVLVGSAGFLVPTTNNTGNTYLYEVLGSKSDESHDGGNSLYAVAHTLEEHSHSIQFGLSR